MKVKILITENEKQLILKAENEFEKETFKMFKNMPNTYFGDFGKCKAGYHRNFAMTDEPNDDLIIIFPDEKPPKNL